MKKKLSSFAVILFTVMSYQASCFAADKSDSGIYFGIDGIGTHVKNTYLNKLDNTGFYADANHTAVTKDNVGFGINLGARSDFGIPSASVEIFYDHLANSSKDPLIGTTAYDRLVQNAITVDNRYGIKTSFGLQIASGVEIFTTVGITNVRYRYDRYDLWNGSSSGGTPFKAGTSQFVPIYGGGLRLNLTNNVTARILYESQKMTNQYSSEWESIRSNISTLKIGLAYNF